MYIDYIIFTYYIDFFNVIIAIGVVLFVCSLFVEKFHE